jgi:fructose-1,6-bisphosphatase/inositol monophosphatase family enzyme
MPKFNDFIKQTIISAGNILLGGFGSTFVIDKKLGKNNLVTEYDYKSETFIINEIKKVFPDHSIVSE